MEPRRVSLPARKENKLTFPEMAKLIEAQYLHILNHLQYVNNIAIGKVSEDDTIDYLRDVFNFTQYNTTDFKDKILPKLKTTLQQKCRNYKFLLQAIKIEDQQQAICVLNLVLEFQFLLSAQFKSLAKTKDTANIDKIQTAFHDYHFLKYLKSTIQLPECYENLTSVIKVTTHTERNFNKSELKSGSFDANVEMRWNVYRTSVLADCKKIIFSTKGIKKESNPLSEATMSIIENLNRAFELVREVEKENIQVNIATDLTRYIKNNVAVFFQIHPIIKNAMDIVNAGAKKTMETHKTANAYQTVLKKIHDEINRLQKQHKKILKNLQNLLSKHNSTNIDSDLKLAQNGLSDLSKKVDEISAQWPDACPEKINSEIALEKFVFENEEVIDNIADQLEIIQKQLLDYAIKQHEIEKKKTAALEKALQDKLEASQRAAELYISQQNEALLQYKASIAKKRKEREEQRRISAPAQVSTKVEEVHEIAYKNVEMETRLLNLSSGAVTLLESILKHEKGLTFDQVSNFITTQLDGRVIEIGNGSSHKCIEIDKYILLMSTNEEPNQAIEQNSGSQVATGGFFRPHGHGKAHNKGILSRFNLELVTSVFVKAKITLEVLAEIKNKKMNLG